MVDDIGPHCSCISQWTPWKPGAARHHARMRGNGARNCPPEVPDPQPAVVAGADQNVCRLMCEVHVPDWQRMHVGPVACPAGLSDIPELRVRSSLW